MNSILYFGCLCAREFLLIKRQLRVIVNASLFFIMVMVFFPLTLPADPNLLRMVLPGLVWTALLFALFLSAERLFQQEEEEGLLEQWLVLKTPLIDFVRAKLLIHWGMNIGPILIFCPILAILFQLNVFETFVLGLSILFGTPAILGVCALAAAFCTGLQQKGIFMALILLPLTLPVMIFGGGALTACLQGLPVSGYLALLLALSIIAFLCLPFAIAAILRDGAV